MADYLVRLSQWEKNNFALVPANEVVGIPNAMLICKHCGKIINTGMFAMAHHQRDCDELRKQDPEFNYNPTVEDFERVFNALGDNGYVSGYDPYA